MIFIKITNFKKIKEVESSKDLLNILVLGGSQAAKSFGENLPIIFENCLKKNIKLKTKYFFIMYVLLPCWLVTYS